MKYLLNILLLVLLVSHTSKTIITFVSFKCNQRYIASTLCENKQKPALECDGKCYLKKQIKKQQESEDSPLSLKKVQFFDFFIPQESKPFSFSSYYSPVHVVQIAKTIFFEDMGLYARLWITEVLRPPTCF